MATDPTKHVVISVSPTDPMGQQMGFGPRSLTSAVYEHLRREILTCDLVPGERLRVSRLKDRFNVSLSIIREALSRLVADGLLQAVDQVGFRVTEVSREDLRDVTNSRIEIEHLTLRRAIALGGRPWENAIRDAAEVLFRSTPIGKDTAIEAKVGYAAAHARFHNALVSSCDSAWLLRFRNILYEQAERYRMLSSVMSPTPERDVNSEHKALMEAVLNRDVAMAFQLVALHFEQTANAVIHVLDSDLRWSPPKATSRDLDALVASPLSRWRA